MSLAIPIDLYFQNNTELQQGHLTVQVDGLSFVGQNARGQQVTVPKLQIDLATTPVKQMFTYQAVTRAPVLRASEGPVIDTRNITLTLRGPLEPQQIVNYLPVVPEDRIDGFLGYAVILEGIDQGKISDVAFTNCFTPVGNEIC